MFCKFAQIIAKATARAWLRFQIRSLEVQISDASSILDFAPNAEIRSAIISQILKCQSEKTRLFAEYSRI
jgi:hypothetical protein